MDVFGERELINRYRFPRRTIVDFIQQVDSRLLRPSNRSYPLPFSSRIRNLADIKPDVFIVAIYNYHPNISPPPPNMTPPPHFEHQISYKSCILQLQLYRPSNEGIFLFFRWNCGRGFETLFLKILSDILHEFFNKGECLHLKDIGLTYGILLLLSVTFCTIY